MLTKRRHFFKKFNVLFDVTRAAVIGPVRVLQMPDCPGLLARQVGNVEGGGGVGAVPGRVGKLFVDLELAQLEGGAVLLGPVGDAVGGFCL